MPAPNDQARRFRSAFPNGALLTADDRETAIEILHGAGIADAAHAVCVTPAGEGNMNLVVRVQLPDRSVILKQARPWVERYPAIDAPPGRAEVEAAFYRTISETPAVAERMPALLGVAPDSGAIVLEDLGDAPDLTARYQQRPLEEAHIDELTAYLDALHALDATDPTLANREMRRLNHAHIFDLPLNRPDTEQLDALTPGLGRVAGSLATDAALKRRVQELGRLYLDDGPALLHGDVHPGSLLTTGRGLRVIDPEFAFPGPPEFDRGVALAHAVFCGGSPDDAPALIDHADRSLAHAFAGVEIIRRLLGVAQLPLAADLDEKRRLLDAAREMTLAWS